MGENLTSMQWQTSISTDDLNIFFKFQWSHKNRYPFVLLRLSGHTGCFVRSRQATYKLKLMKSLLYSSQTNVHWEPQGLDKRYNRTLHMNSLRNTFFQGASSLRRRMGGPRPNPLWTSSAPVAGKELCMHPAPMFASILCSPVVLI